MESYSLKAEELLTETYSSTHLKQQKLNNLMATSTNFSKSLVEHPQFWELIFELDPKYQMPMRQSIGTNIIDLKDGMRKKTVFWKVSIVCQQFASICEASMMLLQINSIILEHYCSIFRSKTESSCSNFIGLGMTQSFADRIINHPIPIFIERVH